MANWQSKTTSRSWKPHTRVFTTSTTWQSTSPLPVTLGDEEVALSGTSPVSIADEVKVLDESSLDIMEQLITQLKMINLHMAIMDKVEVTEKDVKGG